VRALQSDCQGVLNVASAAPASQLAVAAPVAKTVAVAKTVMLATASRPTHLMAS
jgi:hypothetical protein